MLYSVLLVLYPDPVLLLSYPVLFHPVVRLLLYPVQLFSVHIIVGILQPNSYQLLVVSAGGIPGM